MVISTRKKWIVLLLAIVLFGLHDLSHSFATVRSTFLQGEILYMSSAGRLIPRDPSAGHTYETLSQNEKTRVPHGGCVWDIGANNGVHHSNSYYPIHTLNYTGFLFEPCFEPFAALVSIYKDNSRVRLHNFALELEHNVRPFAYVPLSFGSSLITQRYTWEDKSHYAIATVGASLVCKQRREAIESGLCSGDRSGNDLKPFTILSVDTEGLGPYILGVIEKDPECRFDMLILETHNQSQIESMGYSKVYAAHYDKIYMLF